MNTVRRVPATVEPPVGLNGALTIGQVSQVEEDGETLRRNAANIIRERLPVNYSDPGLVRVKYVS